VERLFEYSELAEKAEQSVGHAEQWPVEDVERMELLSLIYDWNKRTAAQLTYHGLIKLHEKVHEKSLAVFLRNNHFSTIYKFNNQIYALSMLATCFCLSQSQISSIYDMFFQLCLNQLHRVSTKSLSHLSVILLSKN